MNLTMVPFRSLLTFNSNLINHCSGCLLTKLASGSSYSNSYHPSWTTVTIVRKQSSSGSNESKSRIKISPSLTLGQAPVGGAANTENGRRQSSRKLLILFSWLLAREKHLDKYRELYFNHGFDVLTVKTSPMQLLFPSSGSQKIAIELLNYLKSKEDQYSNLVIHGFSVGAYQFSELLVHINDKHKSVDQTVVSNIKGMIFDSAVDFDGVPHGVSRAITNNPILAKSIELAIDVYLKLAHLVVTRHYIKASKAFHSIPLRCPALLLVSHNDPVGCSIANQKVADLWRQMGLDVSWKCWNDSRHVGHYQKYPDAYAEEIQGFLNKIKMGN